MPETGAEADLIAKEVVDATFAVHVALGPGLLESVYEQCFVHELRLRDLSVQQQVVVPVTYRGLRVEGGFRMDAVVNDRVVIEIKAVETLLPVHAAQLLTYLKLSQSPLGLLINFNVRLIRDGIRRLILRL